MSAQLKVNPFSTVTVRCRGSEPAELRVWSVTKSRGALTRNFVRGQRADFDQICNIAARANAPDRAPLASSIEDFVVLAALGLWAPETELVDPVFLEAPIRASSGAAPWPPGGFALRGKAWLQYGTASDQLVPEISLGCLSRCRPILWHKGSDIEPALPWWPNAACLAAIEAMQQGAAVNAGMLPSLQALADQGILVRGLAEAPGQTNPWPVLSAGRDFFAREGFVNLGQLLPPGQIAAFRTYWQKLAALDVLPQRGDNRKGSHGEPSSTLLLHLLKPCIEHIVGAPIEAAFSYSWIYDRGTEMPPHRDRAESRYTVSFLIDYAPALDGPTPWPICIHPRDGRAPVEIYQSVGDALLFGGEELKHFRPPFRMGDRSISVLLHYVDRDFSGKLF
jgi:hypothetical protein